jgi:hypothetical protein
MPGSEIIICGKRYDIGHPVVTFEDEGGFSAYVPHRTDDIGKIYAYSPAPGLAKRATRYRLRRSMGESTSLSRLKKVMRQVVVHLDGCRDAKMCFQVLHNERGLSIHFMVDNDGTVYQCLDLVHCAFQAGGVNEVSVGIEIQNRGDAARHPNYYKEGRQTVTCRVHGHQFLAYDFTDAQYEGMIRLGRVLARVFDLPLVSPRTGGTAVWTMISNPRAFRGFLGHYHICREKWDPGPWDFARFFRGIGSRVTLPLTAPPAQATDKFLSQTASQYYESSEQDMDRHFPVGPLGRSRLWHGGVHIKSFEDRPVHAILRGRIVAARLGSACPIGSCNFVLLRHGFVLSREEWTFYSLYYHLASISDVDPRVRETIPWIKRSAGEPWRAELETGRPIPLGINVEAGEQIGVVGEAGPPGYRETQVHFAVFSEREVGSRVDPGYWDVIESSSTSSRFCNDRRILRWIDRAVGGKPPDGLLTRRELRNFFRFHPRRADLHRTVVRHRSEWTPGDWATELQEAPEFASLPPGRRRRLIAQQITPTLWWTPDLARRVGLPVDGVVYSYHPIGFVVWFDRMLRKHAALRSAGIEGADRWEGKLPPKHLTLDSESADHMTDEEDFFSGEKGKELTLEDLADGYPD